MNQVVLIGRTTADPDIRYTRDDTQIANFRLAVDRKPKKDGTKETDFITITAIGAKASFCEKWVFKGQMLAISGSIRTGSYEKDGNRIYTTEVLANEIQPLEWPKNNLPGNDFDNSTAHRGF